MYAFEREVREVQELVQRRDTFPSGVALLIPLAVAVAVMLLPTCVYYFVFVGVALLLVKIPLFDLSVKFHLCEIGKSSNFVFVKKANHQILSL